MTTSLREGQRVSGDWCNVEPADVQKLREIGIQPDVLLCRTERKLSDSIKEKIALFCSVEDTSVITAMDVASIYEVPLSLEKEGLCKIILKKLISFPLLQITTQELIGMENYQMLQLSFHI